MISDTQGKHHLYILALPVRISKLFLTEFRRDTAHFLLGARANLCTTVYHGTPQCGVSERTQTRTLDCFPFVGRIFCGRTCLTSVSGSLNVLCLHFQLAFDFHSTGSLLPVGVPVGITARFDLSAMDFQSVPQPMRHPSMGYHELTDCTRGEISGRSISWDGVHHLGCPLLGMCFCMCAQQWWHWRIAEAVRRLVEPSLIELDCCRRK